MPPYVSANNSIKGDPTLSSRHHRRHHHHGPAMCAPSGIRSCWKLWRHCCCRYGAYPLAVAPVLTAGVVLSLYSSAGCEMIDLDVGFTPSNHAWNQSHIDIGLFYYKDELSTETNAYLETFHGGCRPYPSAFQDSFITKDRTWKVARVMAAISAASSGFAALLTWMIALTPLPAHCLWPGILLPVVMMSFIAEGSKFLIFDIALCRNELWFPSGVDSLPASAESCTLGQSAFAGIAAGSIMLVGLLMVCLKAPEKRQLDPEFGMSYQSDDERDLEETDDDNYAVERFTPSVRPDDPSVLEDDLYTSVNASTSMSLPRSRSGTRSPFPEDGSTVESNEYSPRKGTKSVDSSGKDPFSESAAEGDDPFAGASQPMQERISESRLTAMTKLELMDRTDSEDLIQQLVSDLDISYRR